MPFTMILTVQSATPLHTRDLGALYKALAVKGLTLITIRNTSWITF